MPPAEQVAYLRGKGFRLAETWGWRDWAAQDHAAAFTVAKSAGFDILGDVYDAVERAKREGWTFARFQKELAPALQDKGWWGRKEVINPDGVAETVQLGSPRRLQIIYDVNMRVAHAAGTWARIERLKDRRPFLRYVAILDSKTRPTHKSWHGLVLRWDDPFWSTHFPPNGWRCRCTVRQLSGDDLARYGYEESPSPAMGWHEVQNRRTGEVRMVPAGIDPGWAYNPGRTGVEVQAAQALGQKLGDLPPGLARAAAEAAARFTAEPLARGYRSWADDLISGRQPPRGEAIPLGLIDRDILAALWDRGRFPGNPVLSIGDDQIMHLARDAKAAARTKSGQLKAVPVEEILDLPRRLGKPLGVYLDQGDLVYVLPTKVPGRVAKVIVQIDRLDTERVKGGGARVHSQSARIKSAGLIDPKNLGGLVRLDG